MELWIHLGIQKSISLVMYFHLPILELGFLKTCYYNIPQYGQEFLIHMNEILVWLALKEPE